MKIDDEVSEQLMTQHADADESAAAKVMTDNAAQVTEVRQATEAKYTT